MIFAFLSSQTICYSFLFGLPITLLLVSFSFVYPFDTLKFLYLGLLATACIPTIAWKNLKILLTYYPILSFAMLFFSVSTLLSIDPLYSILGHSGYYIDSVLSLLILTPLFITMIKLNSQKKSLLLVMIILSGALLSLNGIREFATVSQGSFNWHYRISSWIGQPNRLAVVLVPIFFLSFHLHNQGRPAMLRVSAQLISIIIFIGLILTQSRTAWLSLCITTFIYMINQWSKLRALFLQKKAILYLLILVSLAPILWLRLSSWQSINNDISNSGFLRMTEMHSTLTMFREASWYRKLIGHGPNTFLITYPHYQSIIWNQTPEWEDVFYKPRSQYLSVLIELGVLGLSIYAWSGYNIVKILLAQNRRMSIPILLSLTSIFFIGFIHYFTLPLWLIIICLTGSSLNLQMLSKKTFHSFSTFFSFLFFLFIMTLSYSQFLLAKDNDIDAWQLAYRLIPVDAQTTQKISRSFRREAEMFSQSQLPELAQQSYQKALLWSQKTLHLHPEDPRYLYTHQWNLYRYGVLFDKSYHHSALQLSKLLIHKKPQDARFWDNQGLIYLDQGKLELALQSFSFAIILNPNYYSGGYVHSGEVLKQQGKYKQAMEKYLEAQSKFPHSSSIEQEINKLKVELDMRKIKPL